MSMRRHILLTEHYHLMCLLLEGREEAIVTRFTPQLIALIPNLHGSELTAISNDDNINFAVEMPSTAPGKSSRQVSVKVLCHMTRAHIADYGEEGAKIRLAALARAIITMMWNADPSPKKAYTTWMLTRFVGDPKSMPLEDLQRTRGYLELFDRVKNRLPVESRDLNRYRNSNDLFDAIRDFRQDEKGEIVSSSYEQQMLEQSEVIYRGSDYDIISPKTKDASIYFGRGTEWCTAYAPPKTNNLFNSYNSRAPLYIIIEKATGTKWQFQIDEDIFMDADDRPINIASFVRDHPKVNEIFNDYFGVTHYKKIKSFNPYGERAYGVFYNGTDSLAFVYGDPETFVTGGLLRSSARYSFRAENGVIKSGDGQTDIQALISEEIMNVFTEMGWTGNIPLTTYCDMFWSQENGWTDLSHYPCAIDNREIQVRFIRHFRTNGIMYINETETGRSLARIESNGEKVEAYRSGGYGTLSLHDMDLASKEQLVDFVLKQFGDAEAFDFENSTSKLPYTDNLFRQKPEWIDLKTLYMGQGDSPMVRQRALEFVSQHYNHFEPFIVDDRITVAWFDDIYSLVEDEGDDTAKSVANRDRGEDRVEQWFDGDLGDSEMDSLLTELSRAKPDYFEKLKASLSAELEEDDLEEIGIESIDDEDDIMTAINAGYFDDLKDQLKYAYLAGCERGEEADQHDAFVNEIKSNKHIVFVDENHKKIDFNWENNVAIAVTTKEFFTRMCDDPDNIEEGGLNSSNILAELDDEIDVRETYGGYDEEAALDHLVDNYNPN